MIWTVSTYYGTETKEYPKGLPFAEALDEYSNCDMPKSCVHLSDLYPNVILDTGDSKQDPDMFTSAIQQDFHELPINHFLSEYEQDWMPYETNSFLMEQHVPGVVISCLQSMPYSKVPNAQAKLTCNRCGRGFSRPSHRIDHMVAEVCTRPKSQEKRCPVCHSSYKGKREYILVNHVKECHPEYMESLRE